MTTLAELCSSGLGAQDPGYVSPLEFSAEQESSKSISEDPTDQWRVPTSRVVCYVAGGARLHPAG